MCAGRLGLRRTAGEALDIVVEVAAEPFMEGCLLLALRRWFPVKFVLGQWAPAPFSPACLPRTPARPPRPLDVGVGRRVLPSVSQARPPTSLCAAT